MPLKITEIQLPDTRDVLDDFRFFDRADWQSAIVQSFGLSRRVFEIRGAGKSDTPCLFPCLEDSELLYASYIGYGGPIADSISETDLLDMIAGIERHVGKKFRRIKLYPFAHLVGASSGAFKAHATSVVEFTETHEFSKGVCYEIRKAEKAGTEVRMLFSEADIQNFYNIYVETAKRVKSSYITPLSLFQKIVQLSGCFIMGGFCEERLVSGSVFLCAYRVAYYWWNASNEEGRVRSANYAVMRAAFDKLQKDGFVALDMASSHSGAIKRAKELWGARDRTYFELS